MNWPWRFGMIILTGVPAIVGGGVVWSLVESWTGVILYEILLFAGMGYLIHRGARGETASH